MVGLTESVPRAVVTSVFTHYAVSFDFAHMREQSSNEMKTYVVERAQHESPLAMELGAPL